MQPTNSNPFSVSNGGLPQGGRLAPSPPKNPNSGSRNSGSGQVPNVSGQPNFAPFSVRSHEEKQILDQKNISYRDASEILNIYNGLKSEGLTISTNGQTAQLDQFRLPYHVEVNTNNNQTFLTDLSFDFQVSLSFQVSSHANPSVKAYPSLPELETIKRELVNQGFASAHIVQPNDSSNTATPDVDLPPQYSRLDVSLSDFHAWIGQQRLLSSSKPVQRVAIHPNPFDSHQQNSASSSQKSNDSTPKTPDLVVPGGQRRSDFIGAAPAAASSAPIPPAQQQQPAALISPPSVIEQDKAGRLQTGQLQLEKGQHKIKLLHDDLNSQGIKKGDTIPFNTQSPIYMFPKAQFGNMSEASKCLIMDTQDFNEIMGLIHKGAFGSDYTDLGNGKTVVWKFPADLLYINNYQPDRIPNPVGTYPLIDDLQDLQNQINHQVIVVTKMRIDVKTQSGEVVSVHHFEPTGQSTQRIPGISTGMFFKDFNNPEQAEIDVVKNFLQELSNEGVHGFLSNTAHHAMVFDKGNHNSDMTPEEFARKLESDPTILGTFKANKPLKYKTQADWDKKVEDWKDAYIAVYNSRQSNNHGAAQTVANDTESDTDSLADSSKGGVIPQAPKTPPNDPNLAGRRGGRIYPTHLASVQPNQQAMGLQQRQISGLDDDDDQYQQPILRRNNGPISNPSNRFGSAFAPSPPNPNRNKPMNSGSGAAPAEASSNSALGAPSNFATASSAEIQPADTSDAKKADDSNLIDPIDVKPLKLFTANKVRPLSTVPTMIRAWKSGGAYSHCMTCGDDTAFADQAKKTKKPPHRIEQCGPCYGSSETARNFDPFTGNKLPHPYQFIELSPSSGIPAKKTVFSQHLQNMFQQTLFDVLTPDLFSNLVANPLDIVPFAPVVDDRVRDMIQPHIASLGQEYKITSYKLLNTNKTDDLGKAVSRYLKEIAKPDGKKVGDRLEEIQPTSRDKFEKGIADITWDLQKIIPYSNGKSNVMLVWHVCDKKAADAIEENGFSNAYSSVARFGRGSYFATDPAKSMQYKKPGDNAMLLCVVTLGQEGEDWVDLNTGVSSTQVPFLKDASRGLTPLKAKYGVYPAQSQFDANEIIAYDESYPVAVARFDFSV